MNFNDKYGFNTDTNYDFSDVFFEPQPKTVCVKKPEIPVIKETFVNNQDNEKIFLYFIIIILISTIVIMVRDYNAQILELSRKVVRVI